MKKVAGTLKLIYSQYRELQSFAQFGSDLDADTKARLAQGERIVEVLKQNRSAPVPVEKQVAILYATITIILSTSRCRMWQSTRRACTSIWTTMPPGLP